ncbi:MAG TPA: peroxidase family protein, partial [Ilumatobacteraceae bacterium]
MDGRDDATRVRARSKDVLARLAGARPVRHQWNWNRRQAIVAGTTALAVLTAGLATTGGGDVQAAPVAQGPTIGASELRFILPQIKVAERHVASATPQDPCAGLSDPASDPVAGPLIASGLRTVDGSCNNVQPGQASVGAADQVFPRLTQADFRPAQAGPPALGGEAVPSSSYTQSSGTVFDDEPRMISNLVDDQSATNPAAAAAASRPVGEPGLLPNNSLFTVFGQFFDHGMNKIVKGNNGSVFVPLRADDPLIAGADHVVGTPDDLPAASRFMVLTRGTNVPGPGPDGTLGTADDTSHEALNTDSSWVDLSQTYGSHPSHQVFLREYAMVGSRPQATGRLLGSADGAMATWADVKAQAALKLGLRLLDTDVTNIPMIAADAYGNLIPGPNGLAQYVTESGLVEGNLATPVAAPTDVRHLDTAFLNDIAPSAVPTAGGPDADDVAGLPTATPSPRRTYDDELLGQHVIAGDGRANQNVALTAIHTIFEHEHNRLIADEQQVLEANPTILERYQDTNCAVGCARNDPSRPTTFTYGERMFQAARFINEMEYQHVVFEEFARKVQPTADTTPLGSADTNAATTAEFAHTVSRFVDSMVDETIPRTNVDGSKSDISLRDGSSNPAVFAQLTADDLRAAA